MTSTERFPDYTELFGRDPESETSDSYMCSDGEMPGSVDDTLEMRHASSTLSKGKMDDDAFEASRLCEGCGVDHVIPNCPFRVQSLNYPDKGRESCLASSTSGSARSDKLSHDDTLSNACTPTLWQPTSNAETFGRTSCRETSVSLEDGTRLSANIQEIPSKLVSRNPRCPDLYENGFERTFGLIPRAQQFTHAPNEPTVKSNNVAKSGQNLLVVDFRNQDKMWPPPPWCTEEPKQGERSPRIEPEANSSGFDPMPSPATSQNMQAPRKGGSPPKSFPNGLPPGFAPQQTQLPSKMGTDPRKPESLPGYATNELPHLYEPKIEWPTANVKNKPLNHPSTPKTWSNEPLHCPDEHMMVDKFRLMSITSKDRSLCLYVNGKGNFFQLLSLASGKPLRQSKQPEFPTVCKHMHVTLLTYQFNDLEGNKYMPYFGPVDVCTSPEDFDLTQASESHAPCLVGLSTVRERAFPFVKTGRDCKTNSLCLPSDDNASTPQLTPYALKSQEPTLLDQYAVSPFPSNTEDLQLYGNKSGVYFKLLPCKDHTRPALDMTMKPTIFKFSNPGNEQVFTYTDKDGNKYESLTKQDVEKMLRIKQAINSDACSSALPCSQVLPSNAASLGKTPSITNRMRSPAKHQVSCDCLLTDASVGDTVENTATDKNHNARATSISPIRSPRKETILPQETTALIKQTLIESEAHNVEMNDARKSSLEKISAHTAMPHPCLLPAEIRKENTVAMSSKCSGSDPDSEPSITKSRRRRSRKKSPTKLNQEDKAKPNVLKMLNSNEEDFITKNSEGELPNKTPGQTEKEQKKPPPKHASQLSPTSASRAKDEPRKGGAPFALSPRKSQPSLLHVAIDGGDTNVRNDSGPATQTTSELVSVHPAQKNAKATDLNSQEHMIVEKMQLIPKESGKEHLCLYANERGDCFQLISLYNGQSICKTSWPQYSLVYKCLHVINLTYSFKDAVGNEYRPYHDDQKSMGLGVDDKIEQLFQNCLLSSQLSMKSALKTHKDQDQGPKIRTPPKSPPRKQMIPHGTTDLLRSQVLELQKTNAVIDQERISNQERALSPKIIRHTSEVFKSKVNSAEDENVKATKEPCCEPHTNHRGKNHDEHIAGAIESPNKRYPSPHCPKEKPNLSIDSSVGSAKTCDEPSKIHKNTQPTERHETLPRRFTVGFPRKTEAVSCTSSTPVKTQSVLEPQMQHTPVPSLEDVAQKRSQMQRSSRTTLECTDKGKAKVEMLDSPPPELTYAMTSRRLNKVWKPLPSEQPTTAIASSSSGFPTLQEDPHGKQQRKVYQPKYPSPKAQRRMQQVYVPKHMVHACRLSDGDTHIWVERKTTTSVNSTGWLSTQKSLDAQGYNQGNRDLWLPMLKVIAYKVPTTNDLPTHGPPKRPQRMQQTRRRKRTANKQRGRPHMFDHAAKTAKGSIPTWVPKRLLSAHGYYEGQSCIWLPKALLQSQAKKGTSSTSKPQEPKHIEYQWRPKQAATIQAPRSEVPTLLCIPSKQSKEPTSNKPTHQAISVTLKQTWVPKQQCPATNNAHLVATKSVLQDPTTYGHSQASTSQVRRALRSSYPSFKSQLKEVVLHRNASQLSFEQMSIQEKARHLQNLLFGRAIPRMLPISCCSTP